MPTFTTTSRIEEQTFLDPESFCPMRQMTIDVKVMSEAQHDGHSWALDYVAECEYELVEEITAQIREYVKEFVTKTKPFQSHVFPDSPESYKK